VEQITVRMIGGVVFSVDCFIPSDVRVETIKRIKSGVIKRRSVGYVRYDSTK